MVSRRWDEVAESTDSQGRLGNNRESRLEPWIHRSMGQDRMWSETQEGGMEVDVGGGGEEWTWEELDREETRIRMYCWKMYFSSMFSNSCNMKHSKYLTANFFLLNIYHILGEVLLANCFTEWLF